MQRPPCGRFNFLTKRAGRSRRERRSVRAMPILSALRGAAERRRAPCRSYRLRMDDCHCTPDTPLRWLPYVGRKPSWSWTFWIRPPALPVPPARTALPPLFQQPARAMVLLAVVPRRAQVAPRSSAPPAACQEKPATFRATAWKQGLRHSWQRLAARANDNRRQARDRRQDSQQGRPPRFDSAFLMCRFARRPPSGCARKDYSY